MSGRARFLAYSILFVLAAVALQLPDAQLAEPIDSFRPAPPTPTVTPSPLTSTEVNRQDRVGRAHRRRETRAFDRRPLLAVLPLDLGGVRIEIAGLAEDGKTTILSIAAGARGQRYAEDLYRRALAAYGDSGADYTVRWKR